MGDGHDRKVSEAEAQSAMQPVSTPLPKPQTPNGGSIVDVTRVPSIDGVIEPKRPDLSAADPETILKAIRGLVDDIYSEVLIRSLNDLEPQLAEVPKPPEDSDLVAKLLGWAVEAVATATVAEIGGLAVAKLTADVPQLARPANTAVAGMSKDGGKAAGAWAQQHSTAARQAGDEPVVALSAPGTPLSHQFVDMQRLQLVTRKADAIDTLLVIETSAASQRPDELAALDNALKGLVSDGALASWFRRKVTMEWLNFVARLSLGPRAQGQATNMPGANMVGGLHEAGNRGIAEWHRSHDGFVEITIDAESVTALSVVKVAVSGRPGAAGVLQFLSNEKDGNGDKYSLATMPVFRRIWLKTGDSRLDTTAAFVITPEGALEINYDDPKLATVGSGRPPYLAGPYEPFEGDRRGHATEWIERTNRATHAVTGAQRIMAMLATKDTTELK